MKKDLFSLTCLALSCLILSPAQAAPLTNAEEVLNFASDKTETYESFTGDFTQELNSFGTTMKIEGSVSFKKPSQLRMEMLLPLFGVKQKMVAVMGPDKVMWQEVSMGAESKVMKMDYQKVPNDNPVAATIKNPLDAVDPKRQLAEARSRYTFDLQTSTERNGQPLYVLEGTPRPGAKLTAQETAVLGDMGKQKLFIGQQNGMIYRLEQFDKSGSNTVMAVEFFKLKLNPPLDDSLFIYKPSTNTSVIDMTEMVLQMMKQTQATKPTAPVPIVPSPSR